MAKSIITKNMDVCYICGRRAECIHHCIAGSSGRKNSDKYGLVIPLCNSCHNMSDNSVHFNKELDLRVRKDAQLAFERTHSRADWFSLFNKSYLDDEV